MLLISSSCLFYLVIQVNQALQEYKHWQTRESVLEKELQVLREEAKLHQQFLDRLRRNPDFQDEVARKELGYGKPEEPTQKNR
jgi:cell division protein FtsB